MPDKEIVIIGGGPAGLMAADILSAHGFKISVYERKPSVGRKFLMAGRGGLNLTHSEDLDLFITKYGPQSGVLRTMIEEFPPNFLREWCEDLGQKTFIGSSGRIFPESFKASPLLRAWMARLESQGVRFVLNHDWMGWEKNSLVFKAHEEIIHINADVTLLALGGASWPKLGSDGSWVDILRNQNIKIVDLQPANCGFFVQWSDIFSQKFAGKPLKAIDVSFKDKKIPGEIMITDKGIEGGVIYALSALLREEIHQKRSAQIEIDLKPDLSFETLEARLQKPRVGLSLTNYLRKTLNLSDVAIGLIMESPNRQALGQYTPGKMAKLIKHYPLNLDGPFSIERAISTAGGVSFDEVDGNLMLVKKPGVFVAGEMLDWEAPTGGYLLQASFSTAVRAAKGIMEFAGAHKRHS